MWNEEATKIVATGRAVPKRARGWARKGHLVYQRRCRRCFQHLETHHRSPHLSVQWLLAVFHYHHCISLHYYQQLKEDQLLFRTKSYSLQLFCRVSDKRRNCKFWYFCFFGLNDRNSDSTQYTLTKIIIKSRFTLNFIKLKNTI